MTRAVELGMRRLQLNSTSLFKISELQSLSLKRKDSKSYESRI
jgi:hypothetical protein